MSSRTTQQKTQRGLQNATKMNLFIQAVRLAVTPGLKMGHPQWGASRGGRGEPHCLVCVQGCIQNDGSVDRVYLVHAFEADAPATSFASFLRDARLEHGFTVVRINSVCPGTLSAAMDAGLVTLPSDTRLTAEATLCLPPDFDLDAIDPGLERVMCVAAGGALEGAGDVLWV